MPPQPLPRSFKRKYKKLHARFATIQSATASLEEDLNLVTTTALKLIAENDMLLDLLIDLTPNKTPITTDAQLSHHSKDNESTLDGNTNGDVLDDEYYTLDVPEHFSCLPWDLDLHSFSGSHLEDLAQASTVTAAVSTPAVETPSAAQTSRKTNGRGQGSKKRERTDGADDEVNSTATKKKKRKSMLVQNNDTWNA